MSSESDVLHPNPLALFGVMWESGLFLNLNTYWDCPTACRYCFSMLNRVSHNWQGRSKTDKSVGKLSNLVNRVFGPRYDDSDALQFFLHEGYPVMVSNTSDPLSALEVEHGYSLQYLQVLADCGSPVNLLSKWQGWSDLDQDTYIAAFKRFERFWASISITADNDASLSLWEPGAPRFAERLAVIRQLANEGIPVDVRCIPFRFDDSFPGGQWDDAETYRPFLEQIRDAGAFGVSVAPLDFGVYQAVACDRVCKQFVADHEWCRSQVDKPWRYFAPDVSIFAEVAGIWSQLCADIGLRFGCHPAFSSFSNRPGNIGGVVVAPDWLDLSLSWVRATMRLRELQEQHGAPIVTTAGMMAEYITRDHRHAGHQFRRNTWSTLPRGAASSADDDALQGALQYVTLENVIRLQTEALTKHGDSLWCDVATAPITPRQGSGQQLCDDDEGLLISYDQNNLRDSWAACRSGNGWDGRTVDELSDAVLANGESPWA